MSITSDSMRPSTKKGPEILVDVDFLVGLPQRGVDFMLHAADKCPQAYGAAIQGGWAIHVRGTWMERKFLEQLPRIVEPRRASEVLMGFLKGAAPEEVSSALLGKSNGDDTPVRQWFRHVHATPEWRRDVFNVALKLGLDLQHEFPHANGHLKSAPGTLLTSLVMDLQAPQNTHTHQPMNDYGHRQKQFNAMREWIALGASLDKTTIAIVLRHFKPEHVATLLDFFACEGVLKPSDALKSVARMKIAPDQLACLQSRAAMEAVDDTLALNARLCPTQPR